VGFLKHSLLLCALGAAVAFAAPMLRLQSATVGPIYVAAGQNAAAQSVDAYNGGDGTLSIAVASNQSWLSATVGTPYGCNVVVPLCQPINITFSTSSLAQGLYTGLLTVTSPSAVDAPQTITVTVQVGSGIPSSIDMYVPPGATTTTTFGSGSTLATKVTNPTSGPTLSVTTSGAGSFFFTHTYTITATAPANTPTGNYAGGIAVSGSALPADNKNVGVTVHVTTQPIAAASPQQVLFRVAQGAAPLTEYIVLSNLGLGTLTVNSVSFGANGPPAWLKNSISGNIVILTADPTGLSPGVQTATVSVASNASNGAISVPIEMDVLVPGPPITYFQGVLDNATFTTAQPLAPGEIVALFGEQLSTSPPVSASSLPLGTTMGGATVTVNGQAAPVYYVSANQIDFLIPYGTPPGDALVSVSRGGQAGNTVSIEVAAVAPRILPLGIGSYGNIVLADFVTRPIPTTPGIASRPAVAGTDSLIIYAIGLGQTTPAATDGAAASSTQLESVSGVVVFLGNQSTHTGETLTPSFAGLTPGLVGLYQVNVAIPALSPTGNALPLALGMGAVTSNTVSIAVAAPN